MKPYTKAQRAFALRMTRRAAYQAQRSNSATLNEAILWRLMVEASHKPKRRTR